ncbi:hypothetical protein MKW98_011770 [Papaver atlanticum]|uniref:HTH myb-type domain-containing protein n=1 Tax=Papaver atlanticum TaxID=357466 RepID=A0AAD4SNK9_9MAGN|nr:hypothetical protein MKW98_011770 [Papaver atlanticum]
MDTTDFSCDSDLLFDDLDVIRKRLSLSLNSAHSSPDTSHIEDDAPAGLRVMVVDDNTACLFITSIMLKRFNYEVTGVQGGKEALKLLKEKPGHFDLNGAGYYLYSDHNQENSRVEASRKRKEPSREQPGDGKRTRARSTAPKKRRVIWTAELHNHFLEAVEKLGVDKGVPKRILEYMRIPGLTRENIASHLQVCLQVIFLVSKIKHDMKIYFFLIRNQFYLTQACMYLSSYTRCINSTHQPHLCLRKG